MTAQDDLTTVADEIILDCSSAGKLDGHGSLQGTCQYISGAGTVQVEATLEVTDPAIWFIPVGLDGSTPVPPQTGAGGESFIIAGFARVRVRKTVGAASCVVALGVS